MNTFTKTLVLASAAVLCAAVASAQPQNFERPEGRPPMHGVPRETVAQRAQKMTDQMNMEVNLDKKQYKKILSHFKKECQFKEDLMKPRDFSQFGGPGVPGGGMPGGGPGGFGGGMPGGMGGPGGGMPGGGMGPGGRGGDMPGGGPGGRPKLDSDTEYELEVFMEKQEKKLRKILSADQYRAWRAKHPYEYGF